MTTSPGSRGRVIVVEDEQLVARTLQRALRTTGFDVEVCSAVAAAVEAILGAKPPYDVAALDIRLDKGKVRHGGDALEIVERVRQARLEIGVVVFSGQPPEILAEAALALGAFRTVQKATDIRDLLRALDETVALVRRARALLPASPPSETDVTLRQVPLQIAQRVDRLAATFDFTLMETKVVALRMSGRSRAQTAGDLGISEKTVQFHTANALRKAERKSVADLATYCTRRGW